MSRSRASESRLPKHCGAWRVIPPTGAGINPAPFGVTFTGGAFGEGRLKARRKSVTIFSLAGLDRWQVMKGSGTNQEACRGGGGIQERLDVRVFVVETGF